MRKLVMRSTGPKIGEARVQELEENLGFKVPSDYREFLLEFNGGRPSKENLVFTHRLPEDKGVLVVVADLFLYVENPKSPKCCTLEDWYCQPRDTSEKDGMLPVADDGMGNEICLGIAADNYGKVFYWDHEHHAYESGIYRIADSFAEFVNGLHGLEAQA